ncbi:MAG TPA: class I SAM-dependent methyltransferase [Solirubrobacteraceae bacterium]|nr:class I SAM-dependent methyltransferase [Solirubrobacteraceae bacterium]
MGSLDGAEDPWSFYDWLGEATRRDIEAALPEGFGLDGRSVLDFGCGAGRTLRHFVADRRSIELWGCDIDASSIAWLQEHMAPPLHVFVNGERPPLPQPDESFDVVYCISVFTHLTDSWSEWLLELHRVLKPGGLLIATFMGEGQSEVIAGEPWDDSRVGMLVLLPGQSWDHGGPMVMHSPWWIEQHWGRLFDVVRLQEHGFASSPGQGHGVVTLVKKPVTADVEQLRAPGDDPREAVALAHNVELLSRELEALRPHTARLERELEGARSIGLQPEPSGPAHTGHPARRGARRAKQVAWPALGTLGIAALGLATRAASRRRRNAPARG